MLIPHLLFAHMLADYVLQSNWLVARKNESWAGLVIHGGIVGFISMIAVAPYLDVVWPPLIVLMVLHTLQDQGKVNLGPRLNIHPVVPYIADQFLHYIQIGLFQLWIRDRVSPPPTETAFMWIGAAVVIVTRFYDITCWTNWLDMIPYLNRWRPFAYAERIAMLAVSAAGLWMVAPLCLLPRLTFSSYAGSPIWYQRRSMVEMAVGAALSIALGIGLYTQI